MATHSIGIINNTDDEDVIWGGFTIEPGGDRNFKVCDIIEGDHPGIITDFDQWAILARQVQDGKFSIIRDGVTLNAHESCLLVGKWYDDPYYFVSYLIFTHVNSHIQVGSTQSHWNAGKIQGKSISSTPPTDNQILVYNVSNNKYEPKTVGAVSSFTTVTLNSNYSATSGYQVPRYRKDRNSVRLEGVIRTTTAHSEGTAVTMFNLSSGNRPTAKQIFWKHVAVDGSTSIAPVHCLIIINTNGTVDIQPIADSLAASQNWNISLSSIFFGID